MDYFVAIRLLKSKIVFCFMFIHLYTTLFIFLIDILKLSFSLFSVNMFTQPLFVKDVISQKDVSIIHFLWILPYTFDQFFAFRFHFFHELFKFVFSLFLFIVFLLFQLAFYSEKIILISLLLYDIFLFFQCLLEFILCFFFLHCRR